jgi:hypothetical protein
MALTRAPAGQPEDDHNELCPLERSLPSGRIIVVQQSNRYLVNSCLPSSNGADRNSYSILLTSHPSEWAQNRLLDDQVVQCDADIISMVPLAPLARSRQLRSVVPS